MFPQLIPGLNTLTYIVLGFITSIFFFSSVLFHELMHSIVAKRNGIQIEGIRLFVFGGVSQIAEESRSPGIEFRMAIAGPASSLVLGAVFLLLFAAGLGLDLSPIILIPAFWLGYINIALGVFNLLPGFPLDGGRVLRSAIWYFTGNLKRATGIAAAFGKGIAYAMIFIGIAGPFLTGNLSFIWFIFIGWYLLQAAEAGYQQVVFHEALEGVKVGQIMTGNPETVSADISVEELVKNYFTKYGWVAYPVVRNGQAVGIVTTKSIENLPRFAWKSTRVGDVIRPLSPDFVANPDAEVYNILPKLATKAEGRMLVMKEGRLLGILTEMDVSRAIIKRLHEEEEEEKKKPAA